MVQNFTAKLEEKKANFAILIKAIFSKIGKIDTHKSFILTFALIKNNKGNPIYLFIYLVKEEY